MTQLLRGCNIGASPEVRLKHASGSPWNRGLSVVFCLIGVALLAGGLSVPAIASPDQISLTPDFRMVWGGWTPRMPHSVIDRSTGFDEQFAAGWPTIHEPRNDGCRKHEPPAGENPPRVARLCRTVPQPRQPFA